MGAGSNDYRAAERRLLDAIRAGVVCDFADGAEITAEEMGSWGPERTIRATLLRRLLTSEDAQYATDGIRLRGAAVEGVLDLSGLTVMNLDLGRCRLTTVQAIRTTFTGNASFDHATFTSNASFDHATFTSNAWFRGATFTSDNLFTHTTFTRYAWFDDATFNGDAGFYGATFNGEAQFGRATFTRDAGFTGATFTRDASFRDATFTGNAWFGDAIFTSNAWFGRATFTGKASFEGATFTGNASFEGATFTGETRFYGAIAHAYDLSKAQFHTTAPGPWIARRVMLIGAVFHVRAGVAIAAVESDCRRLQAREGVHLVVHRGALNLDDAEFLRPSILAQSASELPIPERRRPIERLDGFDQLAVSAQAWWISREKTFQLAENLAAELSSQQVPQTRVVSLRRATASDLVLSGVGLEDCAFAGAHGLDKLRIDATCSFQRPPACPRRTWRPFTRRQVIFEEVRWRQVHTRGWVPTSTTPTASAKVPTALEIAGIYRALRKGLEDSKDEPGAADFYYGEMEMRRLAARGSRHQHNDNGGSAKGRRPSWTERRLLDAYWAVSGYGLRAWRAMAALTILLVGCAALFTLPAFAKPHPGAAVTFPTSLEFTARESLTLIRTSGAPTLQITVSGTVLDIALRLLAPLLLGLAVLAVRGRIKR